MKTLEEIIKIEIEKSKLHPIIHAEVNFIETLDEWERTTNPCDVHIYYFMCAISAFCNFQYRIIPVERIHFINSLNEMKNKCIKRGYSHEAIEYMDKIINGLKKSWNYDKVSN
jgi:hypothetical protein